VISPPTYETATGFLISKTATQSFLIGMLILFGAFLWHMCAFAYWSSARYEECEKMCQQVQAVCCFLLGEHHPAVADAKYYTAECLRAEGKNAEADKLYNEALVDFRSEIGTKHITIGDTLFNLGRAYEGEGKLKEAGDCYRQSMDVYSALPEGGSGTNIWFARIRDRLAMVLLKQKNFNGAYSEENKALGIDIRYGSAGGRSVGEDYNNLGVIAYKQAHMDQAEKYLLDSISEKNKDEREKVYSLGVSKLNLAKVFQVTGRTDQAESLRKEALNSWSKFLGQQIVDPIGTYKLILKKDRPNYEKEVYDTRSEALIDGPSRI
jgi:tetratricopeptide (TPR) repeat protein